ncbi:HD domain-containing phosphohydrolase [Pseudomonadota bacterium]
MAQHNPPAEICDSLLQAKILIVDDQPPNVLLLRKMLEAEGYSNIATTSDSKQVQQLHRMSHYDLILLDIRMPEMDGFGVMEQLKKDSNGDYLPVLVLTAQTDEETRIRALKQGARDFVTKPFNRMEVLNRIQNILEVRLLHNQLREHNSVLEERVRERTIELRETQLEIVRRLGYAAEHRDNETGLHIIRMSKYCQLLAIQIGWNETNAELILHSSPMHDIGKLGIPDRILLKPGKLDAEEWEIMKSHSLKGAEILTGHPSELLRMAKDIALYHHEKWNGKGYPYGLNGKEIPLSARIVSIIDVFDALTSKRPYKEAWPLEQALDEIKAGRGEHFDPDITDAFFHILPQIRSIMEEYAEPD